MTTDRVIVNRQIVKRQTSAAKSRLLVLAASLPSVLAIAAIGIVGFSLRHASEVAPDWYRMAADDAFDSHDFKTAAVCYQRLLQSQPDDPILTMDLAQSLARIGQPDAMASLLYRLAPLDREGYFPAQVALASALLQSPNPQPDALVAAEKHLRQALSSRPADPQANGWMAVALAERGEWDGVAERMRNYANPPAALCKRLSATASRLGNEAEKARWSRVAEGPAAAE